MVFQGFTLGTPFDIYMAIKQVLLRDNIEMLLKKSERLMLVLTTGKMRYEMKIKQEGHEALNRSPE